MKKLAVLLASAALLAACNASTTTPTNNEETNTSAMGNTDTKPEGAMMDDSSSSKEADGTGAMMKEESSTGATASADAMGEARVIEMSVTDWSFSPSSVTLKKGEKVTIRLKDVDGTHSLGIPDLGINVAINPGETKDIEIPTDKTGAFTFRCLIPCGPGHRDMVGTIVIE